ncbi:MAG: hypothetical protein ACRC0G_07640 [Fusobacteriaceae bacterium]
MNDRELAAKVSQENFEESLKCDRELAAITEAHAKIRFKNRDISTSDDKKLIFREGKMYNFNSNYADVKIGVLTEAVCKYAMKALPLAEEHKHLFKGEVFQIVKEYFVYRISEDTKFIEKLSKKTCLLENLISRVDACCSKMSYRNIKESEGEPAMYTDPITLMTDEEDNLISMDNTSTDVVSANDIHEIITNKVISVLEDENSRAEEDELIIADIKANLNGDDTESEMAVSESIAYMRTSLFNELINESQTKRIKEKGISEGTTEKNSNLSLVEAIVRYTISETLYTLRIHEPTSRTKF